MALPSLDLLYRLANLVLAASAFGIAVLIVRAIQHRASQRVEPLGVVFALVFLGVGVGAAVRVWATAPLAEPFGVTVVVVDWLAAGVTFTFLFLRRRYKVFIETAGLVREYETEYAQKDREARALAQVNEELRRLDQLKSEFLAMVSHELRTPITVVLGMAQTLVGRPDMAATADGQEILQRVVRQGKRLRDMVEQLLQASAFVANRSPVLRAEDVMAAEVVAEVVQDWKLAEPDRRVELRLPDRPRSTHGDAEALRMVVGNLVDNAGKHARPAPRSASWSASHGA